MKIKHDQIQDAEEEERTRSERGAQGAQQDAAQAAAAAGAQQGQGSGAAAALRGRFAFSATGEPLGYVAGAGGLVPQRRRRDQRELDRDEEVRMDDPWDDMAEGTCAVCEQNVHSSAGHMCLLRWACLSHDVRAALHCRHGHNRGCSRAGNIFAPSHRSTLTRKMTGRRALGGMRGPCWVDSWGHVQAGALRAPTQQAAPPLQAGAAQGRQAHLGWGEPHAALRGRKQAGRARGNPGWGSQSMGTVMTRKGLGKGSRNTSSSRSRQAVKGQAAQGKEARLHRQMVGCVWEPVSARAACEVLVVWEDTPAGTICLFNIHRHVSNPLLANSLPSA